MIQYDLITFAWKSGRRFLQFDFKAKERVLSNFLAYEVQTSPKYHFEYLDQVLRGESKFESYYGETCRLEITKEKTTVYDLFVHEYDENEDKGLSWCEVETAELRELIELWVTENESFNGEISNLH